MFEVAEEALRIHRAAFGDKDPVLQSVLDAGGEYAWRVRGEEHIWTPDAIAKLQHSARSNSYSTYKEYAALINDQSQRHMTFRGLFEFKLRRVQAGAARGGRAGRRDRQALLHRRDVARLDLDRGAHRARDRDEPHRRQVEHRRRRRGPPALRAGQGGRDACSRASGASASRSTSRSGKATRSSPRSSRSPRGASASPRSTSPARRCCRSRSRRAPSPAKAASCPARRCPSTSPSCAIRRPASS